MNVLDASIYAAMVADDDPGGLNEADVGSIGGFHQLVAPQNTPFPRVHFQMLDDQALYSFDSLAVDHLFYQIVVYAVDDQQGEGAAIAGRLAERARSIFTDPAGITVSGKTLIYSRYLNAVPPQAIKDENIDRYIYSKGMVLEVWLA